MEEDEVNKRLKNAVVRLADVLRVRLTSHSLNGADIGSVLRGTPSNGVGAYVAAPGPTGILSGVGRPGGAWPWPRSSSEQPVEDVSQTTSPVGGKG